MNTFVKILEQLNFNELFEVERGILRNIGVTSFEAERKSLFTRLKETQFEMKMRKKLEREKLK